MLKILQMILSILALITITYIFITEDFTLQPLSLLLLGLMLLIMTITLFQQGHKGIALFCAIVMFIHMIVFIQNIAYRGILWN
ncbi:hypothetical protein [Cytobacillus kochii]|uniref:hypothetical protein n=1 Tax=Cytobacillus kochii TaxID=859143 RepID=UPI00203C2C07|nr:hypothetical protein [Cytobacillus kochii]MCM3322630.1 hypothetical protein [Cytobacillus kochii]MCM3344891.1 hypothetical protein [Cytobacillus kochii]